MQAAGLCNGAKSLANKTNSAKANKHYAKISLF